jgi:hypothetical protein
MAWYLGSSRTDLVNRGSCISLLMPASIAVSEPLDALFFFFIPPYCHQPFVESVRNSSLGRRAPVQSGPRKCDQY